MGRVTIILGELIAIIVIIILVIKILSSNEIHRKERLESRLVPVHKKMISTLKKYFQVKDPIISIL